MTRSGKTLEQLISRIGEDKARDLLELFLQGRLAALPIPIGRQVFECDRIPSDDGSLHWRMSRIKFDLMAYPKLGKTVFESLGDAERFIRSAGNNSQGE